MDIQPVASRYMGSLGKGRAGLYLDQLEEVLVQIRSLRARGIGASGLLGCL